MLLLEARREHRPSENITNLYIIIKYFVLLYVIFLTLSTISGKYFHFFLWKFLGNGRFLQYAHVHVLYIKFLEHI